MNAENSKKGYVAVFRSLSDHWLWKEKPFTKGQAWIDILLCANHATVKVPIKNQIIECKRGECLNSLETWAERWGWNKSKVRRFLKLLESDCMIILLPTHLSFGETNYLHELPTPPPLKSDTPNLRKLTQSTRKPTQITTHLKVVNYESYQNSRNANETQVKRKRNADETQMKLNNNDNHDNHENHENKGGRFTPPTPDKVSNYAKSINFNLDGQNFCDFYESKGWMIGKNKMKDWKAAVRTWKQKDQENDNRKNEFGNPKQFIR